MGSLGRNCFVVHLGVLVSNDFAPLLFSRAGVGARVVNVLGKLPVKSIMDQEVTCHTEEQPSSGNGQPCESLHRPPGP